MIETKIACSRCSVLKERAEFYYKKTEDRWESACKVCRKHRRYQNSRVREQTSDKNTATNSRKYRESDFPTETGDKKSTSCIDKNLVDAFAILRQWAKEADDVHLISTGTLSNEGSMDSRSNGC